MLSMNSRLNNFRVSRDTTKIALHVMSMYYLDFCVRMAVAKIFNTHDTNCIDDTRLFCDLPSVKVLIERRRRRFVDNMLDHEYLTFLCS